MLLAALLTASLAVGVLDADSDGFEVPTDCDDTNPAINPDALELCDRVDNNCDRVVDEPESTLTPALSPSCEWHSIDGDADGWGTAAAIDGVSRLCLCPAFETLAVDDEGDVVPVPPPAACPHWTDLDTTPKRTTGHQIGGVCFVANDADCDDADAAFHPFEPGEVPYELLDGDDNDCDGFVPVIELDCDDDGGLPLLPGASAALTANPVTEPVVTAANVGLAACGPTPPDLQCWGAPLPLSCDAQTGLWVVPVAAVQPLGKMDGPRGVDVGICSAWDCDDLCPARCGIFLEVCDGLDNDCADAGSLTTVDTDGLPDALDAASERPGYVDPTELDTDGDGEAQCFDSEPVLDQTAISGQGCEQLESATRTVSDPVTGDTDDDRDDNRDVDDRTGGAAAACGCQQGAEVRGLGLLALGVLTRRRRRR
jgi:hypothetical protein